MGLLRESVKAAIDHLAPGWMAQRYLRRIEAATQAEKEISLLPLLCRADSLAVDVGANQGLYVHHLLPLVKQVIAFEPLPGMQAQLQRFYAGKIRLEPVALSRAPGRAQLRMPAGNPSWATMAQTNQLEMAQPGKPIETVDAEVRTLDSYELHNVSLIKIDVEGNEEAVLEGAAATLARERPSLVIEVEERHNAGSVLRVARFLGNLSYDGFYLLDGELKPISSFDAAHDQDIHNVGLQGKVGRYINNFIYVPRERVDTLLNAYHPAQGVQ